MTKDSKLTSSALRITSVFSHQKKPQEKQERASKECMRINFFLFTHALDYIQKGYSNKTLPLFTKEILSSSNKNLGEIVKQAQSCCSKQDLHLMSYKQLFLRNEFALRKIMEWKLSKYLKGRKQIESFIDKMKESSPSVFKRHLITFLNVTKKEFSEKNLEKELKRQEQNWKLYQHHGDGGPTKISPV